MVPASSGSGASALVSERSATGMTLTPSQPWLFVTFGSGVPPSGVNTCAQLLMSWASFDVIRVLITHCPVGGPENPGDFGSSGAINEQAMCTRLGSEASLEHSCPPRLGSNTSPRNKGNDPASDDTTSSRS